MMITQGTLHAYKKKGQKKQWVKTFFFFVVMEERSFLLLPSTAVQNVKTTYKVYIFFWVETVDCYPGVAGQRMRYIFSDKKKKKLSPYSHRHKVDSSTPAVQPHYLSLPVYSLVSSKEARRKKKGT